MPRSPSFASTVLTDAALRHPDTTWLVLGVMTAPAAKQNRRNLRELSHSEPGRRGARAVFVLGDCACARNGTVMEAAHHRDIVYVKSDDCRPWHRAPKVFAWFQFAVRRWPRASWYGKSEDDGMTRLSSLMRDLRALDSTEPWYYGIMQLTASCSFRETCPDAPGSAGSADWSGCCGGCFAGSLSPYPSDRNGCHGKLRASSKEGKRSCELPRCRPTGPGGGRLRGPHCADAPTVPFAVGPIEVRPFDKHAHISCALVPPIHPPIYPSSHLSMEVRSRPLAVETAGCAHAQRYMASLSRRGDLLRQDCASMDGAQAYTLSMCSTRVRLAGQQVGSAALLPWQCCRPPPWPPGADDGCLSKLLAAGRSRAEQLCHSAISGLIYGREAQPKKPTLRLSAPRPMPLGNG